MRASPSEVGLAAKRLRKLFRGGGRQTRERLGAAALFAERIEDMLDSQMPSQWAFNTVLADAAPVLYDHKTVAALTDYLHARLREDLPELVAESWLADDDAANLNESVHDNPRAWAAVRAADLLRESRRLHRLAAQGGEEYRHAATAVRERCETVARHDLAHPPTDVCAEAAFAFALAYELTRWLQDSEIYHGVGARHRQLVAQSVGRPVTAPIIAADFLELGAVAGQSALWAVKHGFCATPRDGVREVWINQRRLEAERNYHQSFSLTLTHELIHSLQGDNDLLWDEEQPLAAKELSGLLCEGATEAQTRQLLQGQATEFEDDIYEEELAFVRALTDLAAGGDREHAKALIAQLAYSPNSERPHLAADLLCEGQVDVLTAAAHAYAVRAFDERKMSPATLESLARTVLSGVQASTTPSQADGIR